MPTSHFKELAQLVLECRQLRENINEVMQERSVGEETPFLRAQINTEVSELQSALFDFRSIASSSGRDKKGGFLKSLFHVAEPEANMASFGLEGRASSIPLTEMIGFLSNSGRTGVLWVYAQDEVFTIEFNCGEMTRAQSDQTPKGLRLGEILVDQKVLTDKRVRTLVDEARKADAYLGSFLLDGEHVTESELRNAFAVQVQSLFHRMSKAKTAIYRFQEDADLSDAQDLNLSVTGLLLECARMKDEAERAAS